MYLLVKGNNTTHGAKHNILHRLQPLVGRERWEFHRFTDGDRMLGRRHQGFQQSPESIGLPKHDSKERGVGQEEGERGVFEVSDLFGLSGVK